MKRAHLVFSAALLACGANRAATFGPPRVDLPVNDGSRHASETTPGMRGVPPPSAPMRPSPFPETRRASLDNGLALHVATSHTLPVVQIRLLFRAGSSSAPEGVAELTARMLKDGGTRSLAPSELARRLETLGTSLGVSTDLDSTVLQMAVTNDRLAEALELLAHVVREPRFDAEELKKLKVRAIDEVRAALRSSGTWTAAWLAFREIFSDRHPYGSYGALPSQLAKIDSGQVHDFHRRFLVPKAAHLVLAGDVDEGSARALTEKHFGAWAGAATAKLDFPPPKPISTRVIVAHRPKSVQSDVFVVALAPSRRGATWAAVRTATQVLGGGVGSRLFSDLREERSLAYSTQSRIFELAHGEQPVVVYAGTETTKTAVAVAALLENVNRMVETPPSPSETEQARRYLGDVFAIRMETVGAIADLIVEQEALSLGDGYWDRYRNELRTTERDQVEAAARAVYGSGARLIVVAGDGDVVAEPLARYGEVTLVDPEDEFKKLRTVSRGGP